MSDNSPLVRVHVNIEISAAALKAVVAQFKRSALPREEAAPPADTADMLAALISRFLQEKDFADFAADPENY